MNKYEQEHLDYVKRTAKECVLFLKRDERFPLEGPCRLAAFGNGVRHTVKGGTGSGEVNSRFAINVEQGLKDAGFEITTGKWLDAFEKLKAENHKSFVQRIKEEAKTLQVEPLMYGMGKIDPEPEHSLPLEGEGDACVYVLARNSGEGNDRKVEKGDVLLTDSEVRDILALNRKYEKFMLVLNVGGPVDLSPVSEVGNILLLSQLGVVTGTVLSDILLGKANPSGKLATTWAKPEDYFKFEDFGNPDNNSYTEGIYVGYRYFDSDEVKPLFPFGYGLSYTEFSLQPLAIFNRNDEISVSVKVTNEGRFSGKEVVQVYVSAPSERLDKPYQDLAAFAKTKELMPGETEEVEISFRLSELASYDEEAQAFILEAGNYIIRVGNSSDSTKVAGAIVLDETVTTLKTRNCLGDPGFKDHVAKQHVTDIPEGVSVIRLTGVDFETLAVAYDRDYPVDELVSKLSDEELSYVSVGAFDPDAKEQSVIGNASFAVAGAAGETTTLLRNKGFKSMVMADGPAGLRLSKKYYKDESGVHSIGSDLPESFLDYMGEDNIKKLQEMMKKNVPADESEIKEQYATAIPIGTAIAQSFNCELAGTYGDIVGDEMERFGVQLWLAPALNIHRSIFCGRNFEYYSEDPLVSGLMAASITEGVQKHKGCGTTIKHYAANNAETNRYFNNSKVSERAMREIYLRGFGICVRKAKPCALMTSYNLLNGVHTSEHRGLIEDILRCEFGFDGIVMTDWVVEWVQSLGKEHRNATITEVAKAGGDVFMPGVKNDFERLLKGISDGSVPRNQVQQNVTRIYRMAEKLSAVN